MEEHQHSGEERVTIQELICRGAMAIGLVALAFVALLAAQAI